MTVGLLSPLRYKVNAKPVRPFGNSAFTTLFKQSDGSVTTSIAVIAVHLPDSVAKVVRLSARMEVPMDECVSGEEVLSLIGRFEPLHLSLSPSRRPDA
jgi:hypothetical protein